MEIEVIPLSQDEWNLILAKFNLEGGKTGFGASSYWW